MPLPTPPGSVATATPPAPVASASAPVAEKRKVEPKKFGAGRGDTVIPVPTINGLDLLAFLAGCVAAIPGDKAALIAAIDATPTTSFPGNKQGRTAYKVGMVVKNILRLTENLQKVRVAGEKKPRIKSSERFLQQIKFAIKAGADKNMLKELMGDDLKKAGLDLDTL